MTTEYNFTRVLKGILIMAKITKEKLIGLIQESLEEYMDDGYDMGHGGGCAMEEPMDAPMDEPMDLESQVAELKSMMQQLMDMMGGQAMAEIASAPGAGNQTPGKPPEEGNEEDNEDA
jgi:hypothetical protein